VRADADHGATVVGGTDTQDDGSTSPITGRAVSVGSGTIDPMADTAPRTTLASFWAQLPREGRWLLSTVAIQLFGRGMTLPFTVIYLHEVRGIGLDVAGALMAWIFAVGVIVTGPGGAAVDKYGARLVTLVACVVHMTGVGILAFAESLPAAIVATTLMGVSGVTWPAFNAMVAAIVQGPLRQQYFGVNFALVNLGIGLGGVVSGLYVDVHVPRTFTTIYLVDAASLLIPVALLLGPLRHVHARADKPDGADDVPASYLRIARQPAMAWLLALTFIGTFVGYGQMEAGFPAFAREASEVSTRTIGWAFAANTAVIVLAQFLVLRRIQGHRRTRVLVLMSLIWALAWTVLGLTGMVAGTLTAAFGVVLYHVFFGLGETLLQPTIPAITNDLAPDHLRGRYNALSSGFFQVGGILGPVVAGFLLRHDQPTLFIALVVAGCLSMVALARGLEGRIPASANGVEGDEVPAVADRPHPAADVI
jgi:MFS family permease